MGNDILNLVSIWCMRLCDKSENIGKEAIIRVVDWLRGIWEMKRNGGQVQQWVDSIPSSTKSSPVNEKIKSHDASLSISKHNTELLSQKPVMTVSTPMSVPNSPATTMTSVPSRLTRDPSLQSDSSHCSSVESLLEMRRADPEAILLGLGFGGCSNTSQETGSFNRIPKRFLQPSKLKGIAIEEFMKRQQQTNESIDTASLGYRGLSGSPHVAPSEIVQKIMERLREHESHESDIYTAYNSEYNCIPMQEGKLSVLSPDNRQFLERQRSKSPDMRNKRMIIGQKSFAFSGDGDLIEIHPTNQKHPESKSNSTEFENNLIISYLSDSVDAEIDSGYQKCDELSGKTNATSVENKSRKKHREYNDSGNIAFHCSEQSQPNDNNNENNDPTIELETKLSDNQRRASYDSNDVATTSSRLNHDKGRRFSDGIIKSNSNQSSTKRRSFQRQSRISDVESSRYCESFEYSDSADKEIVPVINQKNEEESLGFDESCHTSSHDKSEDEIYHPDTDYTCCKNDQLDEICKHGATCKDYCHHANNNNCWQKMRKIMKKNKKLEDMVVKSRREMAEIRDMLSNVLSVRMEPGF